MSSTTLSDSTPFPQAHQQTENPSRNSHQSASSSVHLHSPPLLQSLPFQESTARDSAPSKVVTRRNQFDKAERSVDEFLLNLLRVKPYANSARTPRRRERARFLRWVIRRDRTRRTMIACRERGSVDNSAARGTLSERKRGPPAMIDE